MPVIQVSLTKLGQYCKKKATVQMILETLPYLGLDIEDQQGDLVSVEYSPNRPDFSSEAGIARSLVGILGIEVGDPKYIFPPSKYSISVTGEEITLVRPYIHGIYAEFPVTDETIKQLIAMQEDLHNGIGRRRVKVAIGIHNAQVISTEIKYYATKDKNFSFSPLGSETKIPIEKIIQGTEQGVAYGKLLGNAYAILEDSNGNVLSMPPIINGNLTTLEPGQSRLFIDVTGTDERVVDTTSAIIASMLSDSGGRVFSVEIKRKQGSMVTPEMRPKSMRFDLSLTNSILGYDFTQKQAESYLAKSRIGMYSNGNAIIPRYRYDIIHPIDLAEEVILGFGVQHVTPSSLKSDLVGSFSKRRKMLDLAIEAMVGLGFTEMWNLSLTSSRLTSQNSLKVEDAKSQNYEYLRDSLSWTLLDALGNSSHQEYPQKIFEQAPVYKYSTDNVSQVLEDEHLSGIMTSSDTSYSAIRSNVDALLRLIKRDVAVSFKSISADMGPFAGGRSVAISISSEQGMFDVGICGEIHPAVLEKYGLKVPSAGFEINLEPLVKE